MSDKYVALLKTKIELLENNIRQDALSEAKRIEDKTNSWLDKAGER